MAIYSLRHTPIGRSTQDRPHTAAAHVGYISRPQAARHFMAARMPERPKAAAAYLRQMEDGDRVNARVADKVMLALPKELNREQRVQLVRDFANDVTKGRASWLAALHDKGKDVGNPHCHLLIRDRDPETGKRVIGMSESGSTEMLREKWQQHANRALELAGHDARIDRRSLQAQGIDRPPTIHEGPNVRAMEARGGRPQSRPRLVRNGRGARNPSRQVDYPSIDRGQTRPAYNRSLKAVETEADFWEAADRDQQRREFEDRGLGADYARWEKTSRRPGSMQGVRRFPVKQQQGGFGVPAAGEFRPLSVPPPLPSHSPRVAFGPRVLKPASDGVSRGERQGDFAENLSKSPMRAALRGERPEGRNTKEHKSMMGQQPKIARGSDMSDEDDRLHKQHAAERNRLKFEADQSRGRFDDLMKRSFRDPKAAERKMDEYQAKHGPEKLYEKLDHESLGSPYGRGVSFGRRPGSMASLDGLKSGAGDLQRQSNIARRQLPEATKKMHADRDKLRGAEQTFENSRPAAAPQQVRPAMSPASHAPRVPSADERQANQHHGLVQQGQPKPPVQNEAPQRDWSRMSPEARQAKQHGLMEQPTPHEPGAGKAAKEPQARSSRPEFAPQGAPQANQHKGLQQPGHPAPQQPSQTPQPDWSRMSPDARQANQHRLMERPLPAPAGPVMAPPPAGMVGRTLSSPPPGELKQPQMAPAPKPSAEKPIEPRLKKECGLEM
ncbi:MobA/MobL family protein [Bradyrhizobium sp. sGM-13]|uniref:MobA/MobL family protein n=1 Tax=Bradyrhizobium sp. sGM-13 TaxID=2831781 RepID=UPI0020BD89F6|nr:MobA/MobL family protein [Bradyrhizobium sp. sGM-13]